MKKWNKILSGVLAAAMAVTLLPGTSFESEAALGRRPKASLETIEEGYYKVPMRLYTVESTDDTAEYSMGDNYIGFGLDSQKYAEVKVADGRIDVTMDADIDAGMMFFGYFETEADYITYMQAQADLFDGKISEIPEETQKLLKDTENASDDLKLDMVSHTVSGNGESATIDCIDQITMRIPACIPIYYAGFNAIGMSNGNMTKYAQIGFDWSRLNRTGDIETGGEDEPEVPETPKTSVLVTRYQELKTYFEGLDEKDYVTYTNGDQELGWTALQAFFEKWNDAVADGTADETVLKEELQDVYQKAYDPQYMKKKNTSLENGYVYSIPVQWYAAKEQTISFSGEEGDLSDFVVQVPDYENTGENAEFVNAVNSLITSATVETRDRRNLLTINWSDKQAEQMPYLSQTYFDEGVGETSLFQNFERTRVAVPTLADPEKTVNLDYVTKSEFGGLAYLYDGVIPLQIVRREWSSNGKRLNQNIPTSGFLVLDYAHAEKVQESETKGTDKSYLETLYADVSRYAEGYGEYNGKETSRSYMYDPAFVKELMSDEGALAQIKAAINDETITQQQIDSIYVQYKDIISAAKPMRTAYYEYYDKILSEYSEYLKQTDVYVEESLEPLKEAIAYFEALENFSCRTLVEVNGKKVCGYLPGENIELSEEEFNVVMSITDFDNMTEKQAAAYEKYSKLAHIVLDYDPANTSIDPFDPDDNAHWIDRNYYRYKAMQKLDSALEAVQKYGDTKELEELLAKTRGITDDAAEAAKYTKKSVENLTSVMEEVQKALDGGRLLDEQISELRTKLEDAAAALVDRTALKDAIEAGKELAAQTDTYTGESLELYGEALAKAQELYESAGEVTADDIAAQVSALKAAEEALEKFGDPSELESLLSEAAEITDNEEEAVKYTVKSVKNLAGVIEDIKTTLENGKLTTAQIDELKTRLTDAVSGLVDRSALKTAIDRGNELVAQTERYTAASLRIYNETLTAAKVVYGKATTVTKEEIDSQIAALQAAEALLVEKSDEGLDKDNLADGKYMVDLNLWHATQDKESMGNQALYHHGIITVKDGKYSLMLVGHEVTVGVVTGKLKGIEVKPGGTQEEDWIVPDSVDGAGEGNYAFEFELTSKGEKEYLPSRIQVEEGTPMGTDWVESRLRISWDTLRKTGDGAGPDEIISGEIIPDVTGPLYYEDAETGVIVQAAEGVFPDNVTIVVKKIDLDTEGAATTLIKYVSQYQLYQVTAYDEEGSEVQPSGIVSVTLPIPDQYDESKLCVYHIGETGSLSLLQGTADDNGYTIKASKLGYFALAQKNSTTITKPGNTVPTKTTTTTTTKTATTTPRTTTTGTARTTTTIKTGDTAQTALLLAAAAAALAVIVGMAVRKRRSKR